jgi:hypothetical protein
VQVEGVRTAIVIIENYLHNVVVLEDEGVGVLAVDERVGGEVAGGHDREDGGDLGGGPVINI